MNKELAISMDRDFVHDLILNFSLFALIIFLWLQ